MYTKFTAFHHPKHKVAPMENCCHRTMTILKDEEKKEKRIQIVKQISRANRYQPEEVDRVTGKMSGRKGKQNTAVLKHLEAVPYVGKHIGKVIKAFKKLEINVGISNNAAMVKRISNDQTERRMKAHQSGVYN